VLFISGLDDKIVFLETREQTFVLFSASARCHANPNVKPGEPRKIFVEFENPIGARTRHFQTIGAVNWVFNIQ